MTADLVQGSPEWLQARCGKVTASRVADVIARTKSGWGASRANYMAELIAERLTGNPASSFTNAAMQWGTDTEPQARAVYEFMRDVEVAQVGLVDHPSLPMSAASPDGLVGDVGLIEIKCPNTATHIDYLLTRNVPGKYVTQMQWQMACTEREWCDFMSYDPRMPDNLSTWVARIPRDNTMIADLEGAIAEFIAELDDKLAQLKTLTPEA